MISRSEFDVGKKLIIIFFIKFYNQLTEYFSLRFFFLSINTVQFSSFIFKAEETVKLVLSLSYENFNPLWRNIFNYP